MGAPDEHNRASRGDSTQPEPPRSPIDRALSDFTDDARRDHVRRSRQARADREVVDGLSATFLGTLVELSESRSPAAFVMSSGARHRGVVAAVGRDVVVLNTPGDRRRTLLAPSAVEAIRERRNHRTREVSAVVTGPRLGELLDELVQDGGRIAVTTFGGNTFAGSCVTVGIDQLVLRLDGESDVLTIPLGAIAEAVTEP